MIRREDIDGIAVLRMEHGKVNALDLELLQALGGELTEVGASDARALVLTGSGTNFSAGLDLIRFLEAGRDYVEGLLPALDGALRALVRLPMPAIAAVNGHAIAGGFVLACACDHRLCAAGSARLGVTELPVGVPFPSLPLELVRAVAGRQVRELVYGGGLVSAGEALRLGLVDELVEPEGLLERAIELARRRAAVPREAFALTKRQLREPLLRRAARLAESHDPEVIAAWTRPETREAIRAFVERTLKK